MGPEDGRGLSRCIVPVQPLRFYTHGQSRYGGRFVHAAADPLHIPDALGALFAATCGLGRGGAAPPVRAAPAPPLDISAALQTMWDWSYPRYGCLLLARDRNRASSAAVG